MKILVPASTPAEEPKFDPVVSFPDDVTRLIAVAKEAGYLMSPADAGEIWRRSSESVCASWLSLSTWRDVDILEEMTRYGASFEVPENQPTLPQGYASWLDYAVDTVDTRSVQVERMFDEGPSPEIPTREAMRQIVRTELEERRQRAGIRGQHRLSELMAEMPDGLPRAEGWDDASTGGRPPVGVLIQGTTNRSLARCPVCGTSYADTDNRFAVVSAGALRRTGPESAVMDEQLTGFLDLLWHDHDGGGARVPLAEDAPAGQTELYVCSPTCLRALFNGWVDALETAIDNRKSGGQLADLGGSKPTLDKPRRRRSDESSK